MPEQVRVEGLFQAVKRELVTTAGFLRWTFKADNRQEITLDLNPGPEPVFGRWYKLETLVRWDGPVSPTGEPLRDLAGAPLP